MKFFSNGNITFRMRDVRCQANLGAGLCPPFNETAPGSGIITPPDYTGQIQETHTIKMTDHANTPGGTGVATASVIPFSFTVTCTASASVTIGSTCNLNTSYNAVVPGIIAPNKRSVWEYGQVRVNDGGPDGVVSTPNNSGFQVQGVFYP